MISEGWISGLTIGHESCNEIVPTAVPCENNMLHEIVSGERSPSALQMIKCFIEANPSS